MYSRIRDPGHRADLGEKDRSISSVCLLVPTSYLHVDRRWRSEVKDLSDNVGRREGEGRSRKSAWQLFAQNADIIGSRAMTGIERYIDVAILIADKAVR